MRTFWTEDRNISRSIGSRSSGLICKLSQDEGDRFQMVWLQPAKFAGEYISPRQGALHNQYVDPELDLSQHAIASQTP
jgi:hypothetical protein